MLRQRSILPDFLILFVPLVVIIIGGAIFYSRSEIAGILNKLKLTEASELDLGVTELNQNLHSVAADIHFLATIPRFKQMLDEPTPTNLDAMAANLIAYMDAFGIFDKIRWLDESGKERLRANYDKAVGKAYQVPLSELQDKSGRYFFQEAIQTASGAVYLSPFDLNFESGSIELPIRPTLRVAVPAIDSKGQRHGILIINYNGSVMLDSISQASGRMHDRLTLVNHDGYWLRGLQTEDEWGFMLNHPNATLSHRHPDAWQHIVASDEGQVILADGLWTWKRVHPLYEAQHGARLAGLTLTVEHDRDVVGGEDYVWTVVTRLPVEELRDISWNTWKRLNWPIAFALALATLGCTLLTQSRRKIYRLNADLDRRAIDAEAANRAKASFLANMSHEIRTPMNAVLGLAYLLEHAPLGADERDLVKKIRVAGRSLLAIINDILDFSKIEAGRLELERISFNLNDLLDSVAAIMSASVSNRDIELIVGAAPPGTEKLMGDPQRLQQILINLTGNAIKFTEAGEVVVAVHLVAGDPDELRLHFSVRDTGIGIAADKLQEIFSAFSQADMSTTRRFGGSGLGLTISRHLVQLMGGELNVNSVPGKGSEFWFEVSFGTVSSDTYAVPAMALQHVLIADDHPLTRDTLALIVQSLGWTSECASSGQEAVDLVKAKATDGRHFDLLLIDWRMPELDGLAASKIIRAQLHDDPAKAPVIIMVNACSREELRGQPDAAVADVIITKPITASVLYNAVAEAKRRRGAMGKANLPESMSYRRRLPGLRLLVVDDSDINREVARRILEAEGAVVQLANNGQEAVDRLSAHANEIDAVLMDVQMPVMDGYEATRQIRSRLQLADLPVVALTAGAFRSQQIAALAAGMNGFIAKPFDVDEMMATLQRLTGCQAESGETERPVPVVETTLLPGPIDWERGMSLWRDKAAYSSYLHRFAVNYADTGAQLAVLSKQHDNTAIAAVTHKLKGAAGSLALNEVERLAGMLNCSISENSESAGLLEQLQQALVLALTAIGQMPVQRDDLGNYELDDENRETVTRLLCQLVLALEKDNPDDAELILPTLSEKLPAQQLSAIRDQMEAFDFRGAQAQVRSLAERLRISLMGETK